MEVWSSPKCNLETFKPVCVEGRRYLRSLIFLLCSFLKLMAIVKDKGLGKMDLCSDHEDFFGE